MEVHFQIFEIRIAYREKKLDCEMLEHLCIQMKNVNYQTQVPFKGWMSN